MNNEFYPLENCDDDVVLLNQDTFKISRLKELAKGSLNRKFNNYIYNQETKQPGEYIFNLLSEISIGAVPIKLSETKYTAVIDCQILRIGGKGWEKGKLKIQICRPEDKVYLEFCPDEPKQPESPLDDIRKMLKDEQ